MSETTPDSAEYYFNLRTKMVEKGRVSAWEDLMGPYTSREEADRAIEVALQRNADWEDDDEAWQGDTN